jgi:hypothetical protein
MASSFWWRAAVGDLSRLDLLVCRVVRDAQCSGGFDRAGRGVVLGGGAVGLLDGAQPGGDAGLAGGDGLAVALAVGAVGQVLAESLDLADVGFPLAGVRGDGVDRDLGGGGVEDEADRLAAGVAAGQGDDPGPSVSGQAGWRGPGPCRIRSWSSASIRSARSIWWQAAPKPGQTGPGSVPRAVQYSMSRAACGWSGWVPERACRRSWVLSAGVISPVLTKRTRARAKAGACGRAASQMASRRAVTWSTERPRLSAALMPRSMRRSYKERSGSSSSPGARPASSAVAGMGQAGVRGIGMLRRWCRQPAAGRDRVRAAGWPVA